MKKFPFRTAFAVVGPVAVLLLLAAASKPQEDPLKVGLVEGVPFGISLQEFSKLRPDAYHPDDAPPNVMVEDGKGVHAFGQPMARLMWRFENNKLTVGLVQTRPAPGHPFIDRLVKILGEPRVGQTQDGEIILAWESNSGLVMASANGTPDGNIESVIFISKAKVAEQMKQAEQEQQEEAPPKK
jgi:hypothetical protein